ncbi:unnamed protein product [Brassica rapa subsp. narinosa]
MKFLAPLPSVVKARISGTSAAHIYFDGFIFNFPNQAVNSKAQATPFKSCPHSQDFTLYFNKLSSPLLIYVR